MSKKSLKNTDDKPEVFTLTGGDSEWNNRIQVVSNKENPKYDPDDYWSYNANNQFKVLWQCYIGGEESCCGFPVISEFFIDENRNYSRKEQLAHAETIGKLLEEFLLKRETPYIAAYVPDQKQYEVEIAVFTAAGFTRDISLKSKHGRYTNTRWEWMFPDVELPSPSTFKPTKLASKGVTLPV